jgi:DNA-binding NtrC family response regulator
MQKGFSMPRIDIRIKTELSARCIYRTAAGPREEKVLIRELSLSSGVVTGFSRLPDHPFVIIIMLPQDRELELVGEPVRVGEGQAAVRFYCPSKTTACTLWEYIKPYVRIELCPYCGADNAGTGDYCPSCGLCLNINDAAYLHSHIRASFLARIQTRFDRMDGELLQRVLSLIDTELAEAVEATPEETFVGNSPHLQRATEMIRKAASSDVNVLIVGESGTGKELTARAIHDLSPRRGRPFVTVNCAAIPEGLLEAELFGHEKGAFTGAHVTRKGKLEWADGGTVFLDEVGDLLGVLQGKLLRFLEDRLVEKVGGHDGKKVDVRIISATNRNLDEMVANRTFRMDLFFRLNCFTITLPPLRERGEDKVMLANYFLRRIVRSDGTAAKSFSETAVAALRSYGWPGNVRELINKVRRGVIMAPGERIEPSDMELPLPGPVSRTGDPGQDLQKERICSALADNRFVISQTAKALRISRPTLYAMLKRYGIDLPPKRRGVRF